MVGDHKVRDDDSQIPQESKMRYKGAIGSSYRLIFYAASAMFPLALYISIDGYFCDR